MKARTTARREGAEKPTRDRILDAAEHLFARRGFDAATVREIAAAAGANVAAVGYYFQGKENLYVAVLERGIRQRNEALRRALAEIEAADEERPDPEAILRALVGTHLEGMSKGIAGYDFMLLLASEMLNPRAAVRELFHKYIEPTQAAYHAALSRACPDLRDAQVWWVLMSVMGQAIHFIRLRLQLDTARAAGKEGGLTTGLAVPWLQIPLDDYIDYVTTQVVRLTARGIAGMHPDGGAP